MEFVATECGAVSELALLGGSVVVGWLVSTLLLSALERRAKLQKKSAGCDLRACVTREPSVEEAHTESHNSERLEELQLSRLPHGSTRELFEAYGLFGAAPGSWSQRPAPGLNELGDCQEPLDGELADVEDEDEPENSYDVCFEKPDLLTKEAVASLWEQYEIFGSAPGKWSVASASTTVSEDEAESELSDDDVHGAWDAIWDAPPTMPKLPPDGSALAELWEHYGLFAAPAGTWSSSRQPKISR